MNFRNIYNSYLLKKNFLYKKGFTLIELIIVIIIIAILAAIIIPLFPNMTDSSKQSNTVANLRSIASAMSIYHMDNNMYPVANDVNALKSVLEPTYMTSMPVEDGWGKKFYVVSKKDTYVIGSGGKNWDGKDPIESNPIGPTSSYESDLIIIDGEFVQYPIGSN